MKRDVQTSSSNKSAQSVLTTVPERLRTQNGSDQNPSTSFADASRERPVVATSVHGSNYSVELHIEELVLYGFPASERYRIGEAVERELARLLTEQGAPTVIPQDREIAHLNESAIEIHAGSNSEVTGAQLAKAIYGGLGQ